MKKVLISGVDGFVGQRLLKKIAKSNKYIATGFDWKDGYFEKPETLQKLIAKNDVLVHLAGVSNPKEPGIVEKNMRLTQALLAACQKAGNKPLLVFPSTFAVYKVPKKSGLISEKHEIGPRNKYGLSKLKCEELIKKYVGSKDVCSIILRFSNIYGSKASVGSHSVVANFIDCVKKDKPITVYGSGDQTRDFVFIDDAVDAIMKTMRYKGDVLTFNICSGEEVPINKLIKMLSKVSGKKIKVKTKNADQSSVGYWRGNGKLAEIELGWKPKTKFLSGIRKTWKEEQ